MSGRDFQAVVDGLSDAAYYLVQRPSFGEWIFGRSALHVPRNDAQRDAFDELASAGLAYLDSERGHVGFRSTHDGREVCVALERSAVLAKATEGASHG